MEEFTGNVARAHRSRLGIEEPRHWTECIPWRKVGLFVLAFGLLVWPFRVTSNGFIVRWAPPIVDPRPGCFQERERQLVGLWKSNRPIGHSRLLLTESGTFHQRAGASRWRSESAGTWRVDGNQIVLQRQEAFSLSSSLPVLWCMDRSEQRVWIVAWGEQSMLVTREFDLNLLVYLLNSNAGGEEYRRCGLVREGLPLQGRPVPPSPWKERLLPGELRGTVLGVRPSGILRVSLGSRDGVTLGLRLFHRTPGERFPNHLEVTEVRETDCEVSQAETGEKPLIHVGDTISSWFPDDVPAATPR